MILSPAQIDQFHREGFLTLDPGLDPDLPDTIIDEVRPYYGPGNLLEQPSGTRVQDAWRHSPAARSLAINPSILDALEQLYGRKALPFQSLNFPVGTEQKTHSDTIHFNSQPGGFMAGVWVALEDIDPENGALTYYPGSHKLPEVTMQDVGKGIGYEHYPAYEAWIENMVNQHQLEPVRARVVKGHAFIWHGNLLHGGGAHPDRSRTRHSQVTHYFFEGCRYYTPMNSASGAVSWRQPEWITDQQPDLDASVSLARRVARKLKRALTRKG